MNGEGWHIGVIGAGSWGTALAVSCRFAGASVMLWARAEAVAEAIRTSGRNEAYLPGADLPDGIKVTAAADDLSACDTVLLACPAQALRETVSRFAGVLKDGVPAIICAKGLERGSNLFMTAVLAEAAPRLVPYVLSGPSFARDVAAGLPTAVTLAGDDLTGAMELATVLAHPSLRIYGSRDLTGVQFGGAVKNVLAIACGLTQGRQLGESARAALTTRAFAEMTRLGRAIGARPETLTGLSGLGDLLLTCSSLQSRNFSLGYELGRGQSLDDILGSRHSVSEGVYTAQVVVDIAAGCGVELPVCQAVHAIVDRGSDPDEQIAKLMARPPRSETD